MLKAGVLARGASASSRELTDGLADLNNMIESWNLTRTLIYEVSRESLTLTANTNPHTIGLAVDDGSNGDFAIVRPQNIQSASIIQSGREFPIRILSEEEHQEIPSKDTTSSTPAALWYEREWPLGKIYLYPVPSTAATLIIYVWHQLDSGLALADELSVPPGYLRAPPIQSSH